MKPSIPKGTRDFGPVEMARRNYIFNTIRSVFELYGFQSIETPAMENLSTLLGKYGEEGDKLLFKILNSGDFLSDVNVEELRKDNSLVLAGKVSEKGLRYDLTVPFARYVVQHRDEITFPFKRYQIQPVWRADRPQKGRYREFYQCDADVVGSNSLLNEVELVQIIDNVFTQLGIDVTIKINNRKILAGIAEIVGEPDKMVDIAIAIDKLEKIGMANVFFELKEKGFSNSSTNKIQQFLEVTYKNDPTGTLNLLRKNLANSQIGLKGIEELESILSYLGTIKINTGFDIDISLARGLNYYTGAIFEVKAKNVEMGSISGGGRYDNLTGVFGMEGVSGVGISFGADRIYDVLLQLNKFVELADAVTKVLFVNFGVKEEQFCIPLVKELRKAGISAELFPDKAKLDKQMKYANAKKVSFVIIAGENEINENVLSLKNMVSGEQSKIKTGDLLHFLSKEFSKK
jgi:histidyl-tRNA synthetase